MGLTLVIVIFLVTIFYAFVIAAISFKFDKLFFPIFIAGIAGILTLGVKGVLIDSIEMNYKTIGCTFLLSGISLPIWIILTENGLPMPQDSALIPQFGIMIFWMAMTTIGISSGIKN